MPNLLANENYTPIETPQHVERTTKSYLEENLKRKPFVSEEHIQRHFGVEESRKVLYEDGHFDGRRQVVQMKRPPQPILPPQPVMPPKPKSRDSVEREVTMR